MIAKKHYESGAVMVYAADMDWNVCLTFRDEKQMARLGECLKDLARTGGKTVEIEHDSN